MKYLTHSIFQILTNNPDGYIVKYLKPPHITIPALNQKYHEKHMKFHEIIKFEKIVVTLPKNENSLKIFHSIVLLILEH